MHAQQGGERYCKVQRALKTTAGPASFTNNESLAGPLGTKHEQNAMKKYATSGCKKVD